MFLASFGATGASAEPIAPKCSKIGSTKSVKGYKYICVKSGRTKVWGKCKRQTQNDFAYGGHVNLNGNSNP
jgi:hypothetical protein